VGLEDLITKAMGGGGQAQLIEAVVGMIGGGGKLGGLTGMLGMLEGGGLGDAAESWVGTGANQAVSGDQISQALGSDHIADIAKKAGIAPEAASSGIADLLPQLIDGLTPNGSLPDAGALEGMLGSLAGKFLKG
jgi:uncharacterized protein YidB (DUF937 family)